MKDDRTGENPTQTPLVLGFDEAEFQHFINDMNIPDEQKTEFLETLWNIVVTFVDLGFGMEAAQHALRPLINIPPETTTPETQADIKPLIGSFENVSAAKIEKETLKEERDYELR